RPGGAIERLPELLERDFFQSRYVADHRAGDVGTQAAPGERLTRLRRDGEVVRILIADLVTSAQQVGDVAHDPRHVAGGRGGDRDVVQLDQVQQTMDGVEGDVHGVELIVAGRRRHDPARGRHHANDAEYLIPDRDVAAD